MNSRSYRLACSSLATDCRVDQYNLLKSFLKKLFTLVSGIDIGQEINIRPGKFGKNDKRKALNKRRASVQGRHKRGYGGGARL